MQAHLIGKTYAHTLQNPQSQHLPYTKDASEPGNADYAHGRGMQERRPADGGQPLSRQENSASGS